jgi:hypothetical protein
MLSDEEAGRIRALAAAADRGTLLRWVGELLEDRKERTALLQRLARQPSLTRSSLAVNSAPLLLQIGVGLGAPAGPTLEDMCMMQQAAE